VGALANAEVGEYLNKHFVSTFQKVGSFRVADGQKQGGNVASYFCTPKEGILHAVAGPVDAAALLREARWAVETRKMALLQSRQDSARYKRVLRLAHAERLPHSGGLASVNWANLPLWPAVTAPMTALLENGSLAGGLDKQDRVHLLLAAYPLADLAAAYPVIFEKILGEKVSALPVAEGNSAPVASPIRLVSTGHDPGTYPLGLAPRPTPEARAEQALALELRRARSRLPAGEIHSAKPLNVLLEDLKGRRGRGDSLPAVPLAPEVLAHLNVTPSEHGANFALLKEGGKLYWPKAWHSRPLAAASASRRAALEAALTEALAQARKGPPDTYRLDGLRRDLEELHVLLQVAMEGVPASAYLEAGRYLAELDGALKALEGRDATRFANGAYSLDPARIKTVADLVAFLAEKGMRFAPAVGGDESAYQALHAALVSCDGGETLQATGSVEQGDL
jgi:hypothetical protein